jgi:hypothetical protein
MDLPVFKNLETVFHSPEKQVVFLEDERHGLGENILLAKKLQGIERVPFEERRDPCAVNELQSLDKKLHVPEAPHAALHVLRSAGVGLHSHSPHLFNGLRDILPFPDMQENGTNLF